MGTDITGSRLGTNTPETEGEEEWDEDTGVGRGTEAAVKVEDVARRRANSSGVAVEEGRCLMTTKPYVYAVEGECQGEEGSSSSTVGRGPLVEWRSPELRLTPETLEK